MSILYRKYRPQKFNDFFGQEHLVSTLVNEIKSGKIAHAYLFSGPRGTGKTSLARLFAKAINCPERKKDSDEPCNECSSCREITESRNIDVIEIDAASHTGVDNVRENIIDNAQFKPTRSPYKVFIIDEVHMLSTSAFNALLKTLEEPPAHAVFVLATTEWHKIPATIISRCQRFNFKKITFDLIKKKLKNICHEEGIKVDDDVLQKVINKSDGCMRDAESLLGQIFSLGLEKITKEDAEAILPDGHSEQALSFLEATKDGLSSKAIEIVNELMNAGASLDEFAGQIIETLRQIMITKTDILYVNGLDLNEDIKKRIRKIVEELPIEKIVKNIEVAIKRKSEIKTAPVPQLPLELLAVEIGTNFLNYSNPIKEVSKPTSNPPQTTPPQINIQPAEKEITQPVVEIKITTPEQNETPPETETIVTDDSPAELKEVKEKWTEFLKEIGELCPSLVFILNMAELRAMNNNKIELAVGFSFHKEKLEQPVNRQKIDDSFKKALGKTIGFTCIVDPAMGQAPGDLTDLAVQFGGEVM